MDYLIFSLELPVDYYYIQMKLSVDSDAFSQALKHQQNAAVAIRNSIAKAFHQKHGKNVKVSLILQAPTNANEKFCFSIIAQVDGEHTSDIISGDTHSQFQAYAMEVLDENNIIVDKSNKIFETSNKCHLNLNSDKVIIDTEYSVLTHSEPSKDLVLDLSQLADNFIEDGIKLKSPDGRYLNLKVSEREFTPDEIIYEETVLVRLIDFSGDGSMRLYRASQSDKIRRNTFTVIKPSNDIHYRLIELYMQNRINYKAVLVAVIKITESILKSRGFEYEIIQLIEPSEYKGPLKEQLELL